MVSLFTVMSGKYGNGPSKTELDPSAKIADVLHHRFVPQEGRSSEQTREGRRKGVRGNSRLFNLRGGGYKLTVFGEVLHSGRRLLIERKRKL